jgi:uncharacterized protein
VVKKTGKRVKHVPQRTCVGCRQTLAKRGMIRVVRTPEGLRVDLTGKIPGRGAYLHDRRSCWERGLKGALATALKIDLSVSDRDLLRNFMQTLPEEEESSQPNAEGSTSAAEAAAIPVETRPDTERGPLGPLGNAL